MALDSSHFQKVADAPNGVWAGALVGGVVVAAIAIVLSRRWFKTPPKSYETFRPPCPWREGSTRKGMIRWQCAECGVEAFTKDGRAPKECKRDLRGGL